MTAFQVSPVISAVGSPAFVTLTFGAHRVRVSGDDASLQAFLSAVQPPVAAPASSIPDGQKLGYRCIFAGPNGFIPVNVQADAPGISTTRQIAELEADISAKVGAAVVLLSVMPITVSPKVAAEVAAPDVAAKGEPMPADDEQAPSA